jgi:hypothetical protein
MGRNPRQKRKTTAEKLAAIDGSGGVLNAIANKADVDRSTVRRWRDTDEQFAQEMVEERDSVSDDGETQLIQAVRAGQPWAVKYWLSTQAKNRGYTMSTKTEIPGSIQRSKVVIVRLPENGRETNAGQGNGKPKQDQ